MPADIFGGHKIKRGDFMDGIIKVPISYIPIDKKEPNEATYLTTFFTKGINEHSQFFKLGKKYKKILLQIYFAKTYNEWYFLDTIPEGKAFRNVIAERAGVENFTCNISDKFRLKTAEFMQPFFNWLLEKKLTSFSTYKFTRALTYYLRLGENKERYSFCRIMPAISYVVYIRERSSIKDEQFSKETCLLDYAKQTLKDYPKQLKTVADAEFLEQEIIKDFKEKGGLGTVNAHLLKLVALQRFTEQAQIFALSKYGFSYSYEDVCRKMARDENKELILAAREAVQKMREVAKGGKRIAKKDT